MLLRVSMAQSVPQAVFRCQELFLRIFFSSNDSPVAHRLLLEIIN
jgi:hypothetical protein